MQNNPTNINEVSRLAGGSYQSGDFYSEHDVRIDGYLSGTITTTGRVVIGEGAVVKGDIICDALDVWGKVNGNIFVKDTLSLKEASLIEGDFSFSKIQIEIGAEISGACSKITPEAFDSKLESMVPAPLKKAPKKD